MKSKCAHPGFALLLACCIAGRSLVGTACAEVTFNVNTAADQIDVDIVDGLCLTDTGECSLRAAIMQANHLGGPDTTHIVLPAGEYVLTQSPMGSNGEDSGDLNLTTPTLAGQIISIEGESAETTAIDANGIDRAIKISVNRTAVIRQVTIRNGVVNDSGAGIQLRGTLTLIDCTVANNEGHSGGGIWVANTGNLVAMGSNFISNSARYGGGGIYVSGRATFRDSSVTGNGSDYGGGLVLDEFATGSNNTILYLYNSTISGNSVASIGGGVYIYGKGYFVNSTISGNSANGSGGGIYNAGQTWLYNASIIDNDASHDREPPGGVGGGVYNVHSTPSRMVAVNSLIADNTILDSPTADDCNGVLEVYGLNLLADYTGCSFSGNGTIARGLVSTNTIGALANNGGRTLTHALLAGSEAIDSTTAQGCVDHNLALLETDQRGAPRIVGAACDVGAYEYNSFVVPDEVIFTNGFDLYAPVID